ncbi:MAG TPA: BolA family protein [Accumulibacter sp.]|uniref:BolA family protein n=2 Tax=Accumulibacter sp. TaxID=2053492 RepID=UPI0028793623|nr:BolA family protein [Accumulibacter sp.]MDS4056801.1 BolA family protein [Accumulibacter sp.]HMV05021.1 BolA family protein [Accumulibacter sp.]HMW62614.1 BolA family protein [Accumulibacter sp.]HMW80657.1 BolA family protein [Accumulibacter sp.]HMX69397.1 BolA family protein [Accumulibacter sp.]
MSASDDRGARSADLEADIRQRLSKLAPISLDLYDDSARHAGHSGAGGGAHYRLRIVSAAFAGQGSLARHRIVHAALADLLAGRLHALSLTTLSPEEHSAMASIAT